MLLENFSINRYSSVLIKFSVLTKTLSFNDVIEKPFYKTKPVSVPTDFRLDILKDSVTSPRIDISFDDDG